MTSTVFTVDGDGASLSTTNSQSNIIQDPGKTTVYKVRYLFLVVSCCAHVCQMMVFLSYAPVANFVDKFYGKNTSANLSLAFLGAAVPASIVGLWMGRKFGLRFLILFGLAATTTGTGIRCLSNIAGLSSNAKLAMLYSGQVIGAIGNPFAMFLPTKVAATWFPDSQRALATAVMSISSPLGILLINLIVPNVILHPDDIRILNIIAFAPCAFSMMLALIGIRRSSPVIPPSISAGTESLPFWIGLLKIAKSKTFWVLFMCLGCGLGLFNALYSLMEQLLCPMGYSNQFSGICIVLLIGCGIVGAFIAGIFVDRTKKFELTLKASVCFCVLFGTLFSILALQVNIGWALAISCSLFGFFGMGFYAIGLEMSAECTYPVSETTTAGLIGLSGQIQGVFYITMIKAIAKPLTPLGMTIQKCTLGDADDAENIQPRDMTIPMICFGAIGTVMTLAFVILFHPTYKRIRHEQSRIGLGAVVQ